MINVVVTRSHKRRQFEYQRNTVYRGGKVIQKTIPTYQFLIRVVVKANEGEWNIPAMWATSITLHNKRTRTFSFDSLANSHRHKKQPATQQNRVPTQTEPQHKRSTNTANQIAFKSKPLILLVWSHITAIQGSGTTFPFWLSFVYLPSITPYT